MSKCYQALVSIGAQNIRQVLSGSSTHWVGETPCSSCGKLHPVWGTSLLRYGGKAPVCRPCSNISAPGRRMGENHHWFKRGQFLIDGYWCVTLPKRHPLRHMGHGQNGTIAVHRMVMAKHLNRALESWEHVHHKDDNKSNNAIENLVLLSADVHIIVTQLVAEIRLLKAEIIRLTIAAT